MSRVKKIVNNKVNHSKHELLTSRWSEILFAKTDIVSDIDHSFLKTNEHRSPERKERREIIARMQSYKRFAEEVAINGSGHNH